MRLISLAMLLLLNLPTSAHATNSSTAPWSLYKANDNVKIYSHKTATGHIEVKAVATVKAIPGALVALLHDAQRGPEWIANCRQVVIATKSAHERIIHVYYSAPWPVEDRDMVIDSVIHYDPQAQRLTISVQDVGDQYPLEQNYVRMKHVRGEWQAIRLDNQQTQISYQGQGSAAGHIPLWLENKLLLRSTYETFLNMTAVIEEKVYQVPLPHSSVALLTN
ncbi:START domain-containing protein [Vibrio gazogenes]|uniref:Uncharacterized protein n=1 Tax=Vibrio gazogenes TaxID=687 RepID=A0A1Z2SBP1_VIBGA|nr:START domain-containing protein [Vibrio gazogenes]ASA54537.1 hypothetical protein BSQ33_01510 [Vibrio gazogenes]